jgi:YidC/Oxa1 family membrane protein insertase
MKNMDRTSWIGVIACLALLFTWGWWNAKETAKRMEAERIAAEEAAKNAPPEPETKDGGTTKTVGAPTEEPLAPIAAAENHVLENELVTFEMTNRGAGVRVAKLKTQMKELEGSEPIGINETASNPVGALSTGAGEFDGTTWAVTSSSNSEVVYTTATKEGFELVKTYQLSSGEDSDPHEIDLELTIKNAAQTPLIFEDRYLYTGSASPLHLNEWSMQIGMFWFRICIFRLFETRTYQPASTTR